MPTLDVVIRRWSRDDAGEAKSESQTIRMPAIPRAGERFIFVTPDKGEVRYLVQSVTYMMMNDTAGSVIVDVAEEAGEPQETTDIPPAVDTIVP
jgi:hypothetical protein